MPFVIRRMQHIEPNRLGVDSIMSAALKRLDVVDSRRWTAD